MMTFLVLLVVRRFRILESLRLILLLFEGFIIMKVASTDLFIPRTRVTCTGGQSVIVFLFLLIVVRLSHG
jgi:hypothetical protein